MRNLLPPEEIGQRLVQTIPILRGLTEGLAPEEWLRRPAPDEWSVTEIICHLRDVGREIHLSRLQSLIARKNRSCPA